MHASLDGHGARAHIAADLPIQIDDTLIGVSGHFQTSATQMSVRTPVAERACTDGQLVPGTGECRLYEARPGLTPGPGTYTFHATAAGGGVSSLSGIYVTGADARLARWP